MFIMRRDGDAGGFRIGVEIPRGRKICVHSYNSLKWLCERQCEEPHSGVQVQRKLSARIGRHGLQQILNQEEIHLEKRKMADAVFVPARLVVQISRPRQFKAIFLLVQQQQTLKLWQRALKSSRQL